MHLSNLSALFDREQAIVSIETSVTERRKILEFLYQIAEKRCIPLYFWNQGYSHLQKVDNYAQLLPSDIECTSGLNWLLKHPEIPGIFVFEGTIAPDASTGTSSQHTILMLGNLVYQLTAKSANQFLVCLENYIELPADLAALIPTLAKPLPNTIEVKETVVKLIESQQFKYW